VKDFARSRVNQKQRDTTSNRRMCMSEKKNQDDGTTSPSQQPLPPVDGAEEVTETELDNVAGGCCYFTVQSAVKS
jgi:hypothetical protein